MPFNGRKPLVLVIGPTAVGKTDTAIMVANALNAEVISADSRQIYRKMDIGTAKPTPDQRAQVPHHLVDFVEPDAAYNVTDFQQQAIHLIDDMHTRGVVPMLVGGTGQYITATIEGWRFPNVAANPQLRLELEAFAAEHGWQALLEKLNTLDPITAARIDGKNIRRVVRAIEVCVESGQPFSAFQKKDPPPYDKISFGLTMEPRANLYERADRRIETMLQQGLVEEVQSLSDDGYDWSLSSMHALGYLQIGWYLQGQMTLDAAVHELKRATHLFIRRQYTWFRKYNSSAIWLESNDLAAQTMIDRLHEWMQQT